MLIGLTGQIGSGKTTAAKILQSFGAVVIDADKIGHEVVDNSLPLRRKLARHFGADVLKANGALNRKMMAKRAFADDLSKQQFNTLVHPYLLKELRRQITQQLRQHKVVVVDAALLLDWDIADEMDFILVLHASQETRFKRLEKRGLSRKDAIARQKAQLPYREYQKLADRVILNNSTIDSLRGKLKSLWREIVPESN